MRSLLEVSGLPVVREDGKRIGRVGDVLFAPEGARVVGFTVERPRLLLLLDRKDLYLALEGAKLEQERIVAPKRSSAWGRAAATKLGVGWDKTVIWVGMPARTRSGADLGRVRDGLFDPVTGMLEAVGLTGGLTADIAVGVRDLPASLVIGFEDGFVVFADEAAAVDTSGGAAAAAGRGVAVAKQAGSELVEQAGAAAKTAMAYGASAVKVAARSETGKKALGWLRSIRDEVVDAMGDPEDE